MDGRAYEPTDRRIKIIQEDNQLLDRICWPLCKMI